MKFGTKAAFMALVRQLQLLTALWESQGNHVNALLTLPKHLKPKVDVFDEVRQQRGNVAVFQWFAYGKQIVGFYKDGLKNVWTNHRQVKKLEPVPVQEMAQTLYQSTVECEAKRGDLVKAGAQLVEPRLFKLSRSEFQLVRRTNRDFYKLFSFGALFLIFMEFTPLLCYVFPEVTPLTCILPMFWKRIYNSRPTPNVEDPEYATKTAYSIPAEHVAPLADALKIKSKNVPAFFYPETVLRRRLQFYCNYLKVDNYYLSGLNGDGNIWSLAPQELVLACLERNLQVDLKKYTEIELKSVKERASEEKAFLDELRLRLFQFIVDFEKANAGYLLSGRSVEAPPREVISWR